MRRCGVHEVRECGFEGVEGADGVNVEDGLEGVGGETSDGCYKVTCCAGAVYLSIYI